MSKRTFASARPSGSSHPAADLMPFGYRNRDAPKQVFEPFVEGGHTLTAGSMIQAVFSLSKPTR
jgi:hypothetical protein